MADVRIIEIQTLSMVTHNYLQRIDVKYCSSRATHLMLEVYKENQCILENIPVAMNCGEGITSLMLPVQEACFEALWRFVDKKGNLVTEAVSVWEKPRQMTLYAMISSHTDIGLHNSPYIQRYNSSRFLDMAKELCDETEPLEEHDQYRYTIEGTWFWNNYGMDRGDEKAREFIRDYIKADKIGVCCGVAGNHTQVYGLEEMCRSTYERKRLFETWDIQSETMSMIDNNGMTMAMIQPYAEAGIKNIIFAPNQWNPLPSTIWKRNLEKDAAPWNPDAGGGGSRIDVRYTSALPMVFYWEDDKQNRVLVWASPSYVSGGAAFGLYPRRNFNPNTLRVMEEDMAKNLPVLEEKCPYDVWLFASYWDDQEPDLELVKTIQAWNEKWEWPKVRMLGNPDIPFTHLREKYEEQIPVLKGDITGGWYQHPLTTPELLAQKFEVDRKLPTAEKWSTIASILDENYQYPAETYRKAWDYLLFNDEHSYGTSGYQGRRVYETWMQHRDWIDKAETTAETEGGHALEVIAGKIRAEEEKVVVFNPTLLPRTEMIMSPDEEQYALADVPPLGYRVIRKTDFLPVHKTTWKQTEPPVIENRFYKIAFAENGSIVSIYDKELLQELLDLKNTFRANELVYTKDNHKMFFVPEKAEFEVTKGEQQTTVTVKTMEPHLQAEIVQTITLLEHEKRIDIDNQLYHVKDMVNKNRYYRYLYYAFPFAVENARRYCHLNGAVAEYAKDVTGHGTDVYMAVNEWCCAENTDYGVALMMLDSQLVEFDYIHPDKTDFGDAGEGSQMFMYVANDWLQMHTPGGSHLDYRFRYSITSYKGTYKQGRIPQMAECYANPVQTVTISKQEGELPGECHSFLQTDDDERLLCLKRADDGEGIIARLYGEGSDTVFHNGFGMELKKERVCIDESEQVVASKEGSRFKTYRLGRNELQLVERREVPVKDTPGIPAPIGSVYTGLITEPRAVAGEHPGHLYLVWGQNMEEDLSHYKLYRSECLDFEPNEDTFVADVMPEEYCVGRYEDLGLKEHTCYYYRVCAVNQSGTCSEMSRVFSGITRESLESEEAK